MAAEPAAATAPATEQPKENPKQLDQNPRWKGYIYIILTSLVCFASISNILSSSRRVDWAISISIGVVTFTLSILILVLDRFQFCFERFKFHKALDGKLEGATLIFFVFWWVAGVCIITRVGGIGYNALNIYISAWLSLASCINVLNEWSGSKDIITIQELTGVSTTLRGWYTLNFSSIVVLGSASDMHHYVQYTSEQQQASFGVSLGLLSLIISSVFILGHYRVIAMVSVGGWIELAVSFFLTLFWIVGIGVLTQDEGIAASINGDCGTSFETETVNELQSVPGSNLYVFSWLCLVSVIDVSLRWKAARALSFAHASESKPSSAMDKDGDDDDEDDDGDDDL